MVVSTRILPGLVLLVLIGGYLIRGNALYAQTPTLQLESEVSSVQSGDQFAVAVQIGAVSDLFGVGFRVDFDDEVLELIDVHPGALFADYLFSGDDAQGAEIRDFVSDAEGRDTLRYGLSLFRGEATAVAGTGEAVLITFRVRPDAPPASYSLALGGAEAVTYDSDTENAATVDLQPSGTVVQVQGAGGSGGDAGDPGGSSNRVPAAASDKADTPEDTPILIDVLSNDSDPDGDALTLSVAEAPAYGSTEVDDGGTPNDPSDDRIRYVPDRNFHGNDSFTYAVNDGGRTSEAAVTIKITPVNDPPTSVDIEHPLDGAELVIAGDPEETLSVSWSAGSDVDGDTLDYRWELAADTTFVEVLTSQQAGASTELPITYGELAGLLTDYGISVDERGLFYHRIAVSDGDTTTLGLPARMKLTRGAITALVQREEAPEDYILESAYPNPFNPRVTIRFGLPEADSARLMVYDSLGRRVAVLADGSKPAGYHQVQWQAGDRPGGVYFVRLQAGNFLQTQTIVLAK